MIKMFGKGLGEIGQVFNTALNSTTKVHGELGIKVSVPQAPSPNPSPAAANGYMVPPPPPPPPYPFPSAPTVTFGQGSSFFGMPSVQIRPIFEPQAFSKESAVAPYNTLFDDFNLETFPFYNFWTSDERTNDKDPRGQRRLDDIPRFIKVIWNPTPDLPGVEEFRPRDHSVRPIKIPRIPQAAHSFRVKGIEFNPEHMQPIHFSRARGSLANGYIGPGVIESIVELPLQNAGLDPRNMEVGRAHQIDEDVFLTHPATKGVEIHELKAQVHHATNGVLGAGRLTSKDVSAESQSDKEAFFDGKFSVGRSSVGGGLQLQSVHPSSPSLGIFSQGALHVGKVFDHVMEVVNQVVHPPPAVATKKASFNKVSFVQPSIAGTLDQKKVNLMSRPEHAESMVAVAQVLPHLEALQQSGIGDLQRKTDIPSFPSPAGIKPIEYIGYVLEKYRRTSSGAFEKIEEIELPGRESNEYYDSKILYGEVYRYRVRAILRWTRHAAVGPFGREAFVIGKHGSQTAALSQFKSSYFGTEWSAKWAYATVIDTVLPTHPDELTVRADSVQKRITVTVKLPYNPQRDLLSMRLFRKLQDASGRDLTGWNQVRESLAVNRGLDFAPQNILYVDTNVDHFQKNGIRYVYTAQTVTRHGESSAFCEQIAVRLNEEHAVWGEYPVEFVSCAGVKPEYFGAFSVYPIRRIRNEIVLEPETSSSKVVFAFKGRDATGNMTMNRAKYFVRVESLDTGEYRDHALEVNYMHMKPEVRRAILNVYVSMLPFAIKPTMGDKFLKDGKKHVTEKDEKMVPTDGPRPKEYWKKG